MIAAQRRFSLYDVRCWILSKPGPVIGSTPNLTIRKAYYRFSDNRLLSAGTDSFRRWLSRCGYGPKQIEKGIHRGNFILDFPSKDSNENQPWSRACESR